MMYLGKDPVAIAKETGAQFVKGTFTVPDSGSTYTLNFGKSFSKYLIIIEATSESKSTIMDSGLTSARSYAFRGMYSGFQIGEGTDANQGELSRVVPTTNVTSNAFISTWTLTQSSITFPTIDLASAQHYLYYGLTYNYYIVEIK